jgi:hypothetical protein
MLPPHVAEITESDAERTLFQRLKDDLPNDEWIVLHSLGLVCHNRKPWAEIDFVVIGPPGVFCLEVKGGTIARHDRVWTTTSRSGRTSTLKESPFSQVGSAAAALHRYLVGAIGQSAGLITGYGVAFPDVRFNAGGPDIESEVIYDARDADSSIGRYMARLGEYWVNRCHRNRDDAPAGLSIRNRIAVRDALAGDFALVASLRREVDRVSDDLVRLTKEQVRVVEGLSDNERVVVSGGAGTGKTLLAVSETRRMARDGLRVLYVCFNRRLADHVRAEIAGEKGVVVDHLHGFMAKRIQTEGWQWRLPDADSSDLFQKFYPELCLESLLSQESAQFDAIIVDEAQDLLLPQYLDVIDALVDGGILNGRWRMLLDPNQDMYGGLSAAALERLSSAKPSWFRLTVNCRNTMAIATTASLLSGVPRDEVLMVEGPEITQSWFSDRTSARRLISNAVKGLLHRGIRSSEMVLLSPVRLANSCLSDGLIGCASPITDSEHVGRPGTQGVPYSTIASFKGLEADVVLLVDIDDLKDSRRLLAMYVGASRARAILHVFVNESQRAAYSELAFKFGSATAASVRPFG